MFKKWHERLLFILHRYFDSTFFSYTELKAIFFPLLYDNLFIYGISVLATAMTSASGDGALAAVSLSNVIVYLVHAFYSAFAIGGSIIIARAKGSGDPDKIRETITQTSVLVILACILLGSGMALYGNGIIRFLYPKTDSKVAASAANYLRLFGISLLPYSMYTVIINVFRGMGETKKSLSMSVVLNSTHLIFTWIYVRILHLGVTGLGLAYLSARVVSVFYAFILLMNSDSIRMAWKDFLRVRFSTIREVLSLGFPVSAEQVLTQAGILVVQMIVSRMSVLEMDAYGVVNSLLSLFNTFALTLNTLMVTVSGQCVGHGDIKLVREYCRKFIVAGRWVLLADCLILYPLTPLLLKLYAPSAAAVPTIYIALAVSVLPYPLVWSPANLIPPTIRSAGDVNYASVVSLISMAIGRIIIGYILALPLGLGVPGICLGQCAEWFIRGVIMKRRFAGDAWIKFRPK